MLEVELTLETGSNACYIKPNPPNKKVNDIERKQDDGQQSKEQKEEQGVNFAKLLP